MGYTSFALISRVLIFLHEMSLNNPHAIIRHLTSYSEAL